MSSCHLSAYLHSYIQHCNYILILKHIHGTVPTYLHIKFKQLYYSIQLLILIQIFSLSTPTPISFQSVRFSIYTYSLTYLPCNIVNLHTYLSTYHIHNHHHTSFFSPFLLPPHLNPFI